MKIKIVIDGADGMEDAARRIADLLDMVEGIRNKRKKKRSEKESREIARRLTEYKNNKETAKWVAREVYREMKEEEAKEKSPADETGEIKIHFDVPSNMTEAEIKENAKKMVELLKSETAAITSRNNGDVADGVEENIQQG